MPESSSSPVCGSRRSCSVGSSSPSRRSAVAIFSSSPFDFGVTAKLITGSGRSSGGADEVVLRVDEHVAGLHVLQLRDRADVAGAERVARLRLLALQQQHLADPLLRVVAALDEVRVGRDGAGEDAEDVDPAGERVGERLEDERGRLGVAELDRDRLLRRRRDALDEQVEQRGRAEVLRRDAAGDRVDLVARDGVLERVRDVLGRQLLALEVARHQRLVGLDDRVEQLRAVLLDLVGHLRRDLDRLALAAAVGLS